MPTRRSSFGADCAYCGKELIAPERSEYRDERHVLHFWRCPICDRSFEVIWCVDTKFATDIRFDCLVYPNNHPGRDGITPSTNA